MSQFPLPSDLKSKMSDLTDQLYNAWKTELIDRMLNLQFSGTISLESLNLEQSQIGRLPNIFLRTAISKIENELNELDYGCNFTFDNVVEKENWVLKYHIELPDDE